MTTRVVYKYPIEDMGTIVAAIDQKVLLVGLDPKIDTVCLWIEQKLGEGEAERIQYLIMGTGFGLEDEDGFHVGSCITPNGYVWHVYGKVL